jgi:hypothetical protein
VRAPTPNLESLAHDVGRVLENLGQVAAHVAGSGRP